MLLRGVRRDHSHDDVVTFCESHILVGEVVVGLGVNVRFRLRFIINRCYLPPAASINVLTYLHNGRDERLTDVEGRVVHEILA